MTNPLLEQTTLPAFSAIKPEHILVAVEQQIQEDRKYLEQILKQVKQPTWDNMIAPLAEQADKLSKLFSPVSHLNAVVSNDQLREQHDACLPILADYYSEVGQNRALYDAYLEVAKDAQLTATQQRIIEDETLGFRLAGVSLNEAEQGRFREIKSRLSELGSLFSNHVLDATMAWSKHFTDKSPLKGLPVSAIATAEQAAKEKHQQGYLLTLDIPCYMAVMTYADDSSLRQEMYRAHCTRASDQAPEAQGEWNNTPIIRETLALRHEMAGLLGYASYADYSLAMKMADDPAQVLDFLDKLADLSINKASAELEELTVFAHQLDQIEALNPWDVAYYSEKLREKKYDISEEELRPWFPEDQVLKGLFEITSRLYKVSFKERDEVDKWHKHVRFFDIFNEQGTQLGSFYLDLYARSHKRGGAWMDSCRDRSRRSQGELQLPVAYLTCNFTSPVGDKPALFTHDEVVTLFHEFGHGLHHLMTEIDEIQVSGINGVAWDAVELPSQFMENFCYEKESLLLIARHVETKEPLSDEVLERLNAARQFQAAMQMLRQLEFSLFDFKIHLDYQAENDNQFAEILKSVREKVAVIQPPSWNRFENGFSHIFAGGYAAGYYSYKWAEVLSADVWCFFEEQKTPEQGIFNDNSGQRFLKTILSQGGSKKAMELFIDFRGREPSVEPLLVQQGITANP
ncbi:MAG: oligopeptidase A [Gammaproteobacteria bacterium]|nr:MAG: oligopeptidase A [Gammaproteobacteria bacterium]